MKTPKALIIYPTFMICMTLCLSPVFGPVVAFKYAVKGDWQMVGYALIVIASGVLFNRFRVYKWFMDRDII